MSRWITVQAERALYVDQGRETILCDRLPSPVTLLIKLAPPLPAESGLSDLAAKPTTAALEMDEPLEFPEPSGAGEP